MVLIRSGLLLYVLLLSAYIAQYGEATSTVANGDSVYKCSTKLVSGEAVIVTNPGAELTKGCVVEGVDITFDIEAMYKANKAVNGKLPPIVINIEETVFVNSKIKLINAHYIAEDIMEAVPFLFTMSKSTVSGTSEFEFGNKDKQFKLPPQSHIRILHSKLTVSFTGENIATKDKYYLFTFHSVQIMKKSSIEIAHNVISMEGKGIVESMAVFRIHDTIRHGMVISDSSSFTVVNNEININGESSQEDHYYQTVWEQSKSPLSISENSIYTWAHNNITMHGPKGSKNLVQAVWFIHSKITISAMSHFLVYSNRVLMEAEEYKVSDGTSVSSVMYIDGGNTHEKTASYADISKSSSMKWKDNCVAVMPRKVHHVYIMFGKWSIKEMSQLLWDGNYFTTTSVHKQSNIKQLIDFIWLQDAPGNIVLDSISTLSFKNTNVHSNSAADSGTATGSVIWHNKLTSYTTAAGSQFTMEWTSSQAKDSTGSPIQSLNNSNLQQYMCVGMSYVPYTPTDVTIPQETTVTTTAPITATTQTTTGHNPTSATAISSTIPAVLICGIVWLYLSHH